MGGLNYHRNTKRSQLNKPPLSILGNRKRKVHIQVVEGEWSESLYMKTGVTVNNTRK